MSTHIDITDDYDGPVFEKLAHHTLPRNRGRDHIPVIGMVEGPRPQPTKHRTPAQRARLAAIREDRRRAKQERQARQVAAAVAELQDHFNRRRSA